MFRFRKRVDPLAGLLACLALLLASAMAARLVMVGPDLDALALGGFSVIIAACALLVQALP